MRRKTGTVTILCVLLVFVLGLTIAAEESIRVSTSTGTGFIVSSEGYILTNEHVVHDATSVKVTIAEQEYKAKVVETDSEKDLALLKASTDELATVRLGNSAKVQIGDKVLAIGCPRNVCGTTTKL